jgi:RNA polymerase-binding transcription factor DksA
VRERLEAERAMTERRLVELHRSHASVVASSEADPADDEHDPDGATIAFERQQVVALIKAAEARLDEVARASARLDDGVSGTCASCGEAITPERLDALPTTNVCVLCAR